MKTKLHKKQGNNNIDDYLNKEDYLWEVEIQVML